MVFSLTTIYLKIYEKSYRSGEPSIHLSSFTRGHLRPFWGQTRAFGGQVTLNVHSSWKYMLIGNEFRFLYQFKMSNAECNQPKLRIKHCNKCERGKVQIYSNRRLSFRQNLVLLFNVLNCLVSYYKTKFFFKGREARPRPTHVQTANGCGSLGTKKYFKKIDQGFWTSFICIVSWFFFRY